MVKGPVLVLHVIEEELTRSDGEPACHLENNSHRIKLHAKNDQAEGDVTEGFHLDQVVDGLLLDQGDDYCRYQPDNGYNSEEHYRDERGAVFVVKRHLKGDHFESRWVEHTCR